MVTADNKGAVLTELLIIETSFSKKKKKKPVWCQKKNSMVARVIISPDTKLSIYLDMIFFKIY